MTDSPALERRLGTTDAVVIGLGSMIGAGVFTAFAPAAQAAGSGLLIGLAVAAAVAYCNATASAQLAAAYPTSGGTYIYGRERLRAWPGFVAGWGFVIGKTASCAAMALTYAAYAVPDAWQRPVAIAAVVLLAAVNYRGVTRTAALVSELRGQQVLLRRWSLAYPSGSAGPPSRTVETRFEHRSASVVRDRRRTPSGALGTGPTSRSGPFLLGFGRASEVAASPGSHAGAGDVCPTGGSPVGIQD